VNGVSFASTTHPRGRLRLPLASLPWLGVSAALVVVVVGIWIKLDGGQLGVPIPPFVMRWEPVVHHAPYAVLAAVVLATGVLIAPLLMERVRSRVVFAVSVYVLALALGLALNSARVGPAGLSKVFLHGRGGSVESEFEYLLALPLLNHGVGFYLHHFAALMPFATTHVKGNPPGPLIAFHLLGITTANRLAALCIGLGALTAPLAYDLGRVLGDERRGRLAGLLTAFSPAMLLFGVTSVDYAFATLGLLAACLLVREGRSALIAGSILAAVASFFSWLLLGIPAWAAVVTLRRRGMNRAAALCLSVGSAVVLLNAVLFVLYGYDPFSALSATASAYSHGIASIRPYAFWLFGSPAAWAVMLGLPVFWLMLRSLTTRDAAAIAICSLILVASVIGLTKAETERVWLPFVPLACVAAASALPARRLHLLLGFLAIQALAIELLFFTVW
jgi:hypothetical protein